MTDFKVSCIHNLEEPGCENECFPTPEGTHGGYCRKPGKHFINGEWLCSLHGLSDNGLFCYNCADVVLERLVILRDSWLPIQAPYKITEALIKELEWHKTAIRENETMHCIRIKEICDNLIKHTPLNKEKECS